MQNPTLGDYFRLYSPAPRGLQLEVIRKGKKVTPYSLPNEFFGYFGIKEDSIRKRNVLNWEYFLLGKGFITKVGYVLQLTDNGENFGIPIVRIGTRLENELYKMRHKPCSLMRILGFSNGSEKMLLYKLKIMEFLAENPDTYFPPCEINKELGIRGKKEKEDIHFVLVQLGETGAIDYLRKKKTKKTYIMSERLNAQEVYNKIREGYPDFYYKKDTEKVVNYLNLYPDEEFNISKVSKETDVNVKRVSQILKYLREIGAIEEKETTKSCVKANEVTKLLARKLKPVVESVSTRNPYREEFLEDYNDFEKNEKEWKKAAKNQIEIYSSEAKKHLSLKEKKKIKKAIKDHLSIVGKANQQEIRENVNRKLNKSLGRKVIVTILTELCKEGRIRRDDQYYYSSFYDTLISLVEELEEEKNFNLKYNGFL